MLKFWMHYCNNVVGMAKRIWEIKKAPQRGAFIIKAEACKKQALAFLNYYSVAEASSVGSLTVKAIRLSVGLNFKINV